MVSRLDDLAARMKGYEAATRYVIPPDSWTVTRVDGRAFHTLLRGCRKPFDSDVVVAMNAVAEALCAATSGIELAYSQSDEVSVVFSDLVGPTTQPWFGGVVQKVASVSASLAAVTFDRSWQRERREKVPTFDARVFSLPSREEVVEYLRWRQADCVRNSVEALAQSKFSPRVLHGLSQSAMRELLVREAGVDWYELDPALRLGRLTRRVVEERDVTFVDKRTSEEKTTRAVRSRWETTPAPDVREESALDGILGVYA